MSAFLPNLTDTDSDDSDNEYEKVETPIMTPTRGRPKKPVDVYQNLHEVFDQHKLNYIIEHPDEFKNQMREQCFGGTYDPFLLAKKYLLKSHDGKINVCYKQSEGIGRFCALSSLSMQCMPREIRHTISNGYTDIDMANAHPVILLHLCHGRNLRTPMLRRYIKNRDEYLLTISEDRSIAKQIINSMVNAGTKAYNTIENKPEWLKKFKSEIAMIHREFAKDAAFKTHKHAYNREASYMNLKLCEFENKILMCLWAKMGNPKDCVLCFDGLMVRDTYDLVELETVVFETLKIKIKLVVKDMNEGFDIGDVADYVEPKINTSFDFEDKFDYRAFQNEHREQKFNSWADVHLELGTIYPRVIGRVLRGEGSYIKKLENGCVDVVKKLGASDFNIYVSGDKSKFSEYMFQQDGLGNYICKLDGNYPNDFNLWTGFQGKRTDKTPPGLDMMKEFLLETWASGNVDHYNYIVSWFAGLLTNKTSINMVALAMVAKQGTGKGFFLSFMKYILRAVNVCEVAGIQPITQKHNTLLQNKRLVVINEMSSTKDEFKSNFDKIKTYITDPSISIEPKGVNAYQIDNISNFLLFTNHRDAIIVEESDRRYAIFEMSDVHRNDTDYFDTLAAECFNQETADAFYTYLIDFAAVPIKSIPDTDLRTEMINLSKSTPLKFLDAVIDDNIYDSETDFVGATLFYQKYISWCDENGERNKFTSTKFGTCIKSRVTKRRTAAGNVYDLPIKM